MSLQKALDTRRAAEAMAGPASRSAESAARTLQIESGGCVCWLLAWSQFVSARYEDKSGSEELVLRFAENEVVVQGKRLARLLPDVAALRLECLRAQLRPEMAASDGPEPVVASLQVRALSRMGAPEGKTETS
jgi:hypothetical protein